MHFQAANQDPEFKHILKAGVLAIDTKIRERPLTPVEEGLLFSQLELQLELARRNLPIIGYNGYLDTRIRTILQAANQDPALKQLLKDGLIAIEVRRGEALSSTGSPPLLGLVKAHVEVKLADIRLQSLMEAKNRVGILNLLNRRKAREDREILNAARAELNQARIELETVRRSLEEEEAQLGERAKRERMEALINKNIEVLTIAPSGNEAGKLAIPVEGDPKKIDADHASCLICMEPYKDGADLGLLKCNHHADRACLKKWLHVSNLCPMCREPAW